MILSTSKDALMQHWKHLKNKFNINLFSICPSYQLLATIKATIKHNVLPISKSFIVQKCCMLLICCMYLKICIAAALLFFFLLSDNKDDSELKWPLVYQETNKWVLMFFFCFLKVFCLDFLMIIKWNIFLWGTSIGIFCLLQFKKIKKKAQTNIWTVFKQNNKCFICIYTQVVYFKLVICWDSSQIHRYLYW